MAFHLTEEGDTSTSSLAAPGNRRRIRINSPSLCGFPWRRYISIIVRLVAGCWRQWLSWHLGGAPALGHSCRAPGPLCGLLAARALGVCSYSRGHRALQRAPCSFQRRAAAAVLLVQSALGAKINHWPAATEGQILFSSTSPPCFTTASPISAGTWRLSLSPAHLSHLRGQISVSLPLVNPGHIFSPLLTLHLPHPRARPRPPAHDQTPRGRLRDGNSIHIRLATCPDGPYHLRVPFLSHGSSTTRVTTSRRQRGNPSALPIQIQTTASHAIHTLSPFA